MTYNEYIQNIIDTRGQWNIPEGEYWEGHHIVPRCKGGSGSRRSKHKNVIWLYPREHFIAHKLLAEENPNDIKLVCAYSMMAFPKSKTQTRYELTPDEYEEARIFCNTVQSTLKKGVSSRGSGWHHTEETRKKQSKSRKGVSPWNKGKKTKPTSDETKKKQSDSAKRLWKDDKYRTKVISSMTGKKKSDETRQKHREAAKGNTKVRGYHWYNNGVNLVRALNCPDGYVKGVGNLRKNKNQYTK